MKPLGTLILVFVVWIYWDNAFYIALALAVLYDLSENRLTK